MRRAARAALVGGDHDADRDVLSGRRKDDAPREFLSFG